MPATYQLASDAAIQSAYQSIGGNTLGQQEVELLTQIFVALQTISGGGPSGALTDTQLRASPVPISGTVTANTGGLTDAQLRASAVPVSGPATDAQMRASALPVADALADAVLGTTAGAAVITDANGTIQQYLRGLVKLIAANISVVALPQRGTGTNRSIAITTGGTAQQAAASNASRNWLFIQNASDTDMWVNLLGAATAGSAADGSISVKAGTGVAFNSGFMLTGAVNVLCATTGKILTCIEG